MHELAGAFLGLHEIFRGSQKKQRRLPERLRIFKRTGNVQASSVKKL